MQKYSYVVGNEVRGNRETCEIKIGRWVTAVRVIEMRIDSSNLGVDVWSIDLELDK